MKIPKFNSCVVNTKNIKVVPTEKRTFIAYEEILKMVGVPVNHASRCREEE